MTPERMLMFGAALVVFIVVVLILLKVLNTA